MRLVILSGLSGSGKSVALHMLEDLDYYCVDNIPASLLQEFVRVTLLSRDPAYQDMAIGIDARNRLEDIQSVPATVRQLRTQGIECEIVFLHAEEGVLLKRYNETHRPHPLAEKGRLLRDAIRAERELLGVIADEADVVLDTTRTSIHDLRELVRERIHRGERRGLSLMLQSFGFRHGLPGDSDFIFDARGLPNPYWEPSLRALTGKDPDVVRFLDETCIRIGNDEYAKANKSYGLTTLKEKHVATHGDIVRLRFRGKSKQEHDVTLRDRRLAKIVNELQEMPGQELFQYRQEDGEYAKVDSVD
ncbi:MAG: RNase adapter RapZ, partial [Gammaproteobacteria bacterium]|nr:RNase adapter RapZ [Gammaproteobacteria bacterium]